MKKMFLTLMVLFSSGAALAAQNVAPAIEHETTRILESQDELNYASFTLKNRCKPGDVFCGGKCHSSIDKCPGRGGNDRHDDWRRPNPPRRPYPPRGPGYPYPGPGYCQTRTLCSPCVNSYYGPVATCQTVDCYNNVVNQWNQRCY